jgi:hypothetical protein
MSKKARRIMAQAHQLMNVEEASRAVCAGFWMLREFDAELAPSARDLSPDWLDQYRLRVGWLIDKLDKDVAALAVAVWGKEDAFYRMAWHYDDREFDPGEPAEQQDAA